MLRESSTKQIIGTAKLPLLPILQEHVEKTYTFEKTPLLPPRRCHRRWPLYSVRTSAG